MEICLRIVTGPKPLLTTPLLAQQVVCTDRLRYDPLLFRKPYTAHQHMKTIDLLSCPETTLTAELKRMKSKELERHTRKLLLKLGLNDYDAVMATVIKAIAKLDASQENRFSALQAVIRSFLVSEKQKVEQQPVVERLAIIMMLLVAKKFHKIHAVSN